MSFIKNNFLLENKTAKKLYFKVAKDLPIFDYHCHLSEKQILENKPFEDLFELWLLNDHYKWKLMRQCGIGEEYITGNKSHFEKFVSYCKVLSSAFANPLNHWSHLELKTYFDIDLEINEANAKTIWDLANSKIKKDRLTPVKLIENSNVKCLFTTNEIFDELSTFKKLKAKKLPFKVIPAFRADKLMAVDNKDYSKLVKKLGKIRNINDLEKAIESKLDEFISLGTKACDIALETVYEISSQKDANSVLLKALANKKISTKDLEVFKGYLTYFLFKLYAKKNLVVELHLGATRNNNKVMFEKLGPDTGFDGIGSVNPTANLKLLLDKLNSEKLLPKTILFNLNPNWNMEFMVLAGCYQEKNIKGKVQVGAAWWFLDNKEGINRHLKDLSSTGNISSFVGMLTDSRSFLSYARHHYFRRLLCNYFGTLIENGEMSKDMSLVKEVIKDICINNSLNYFNIK